MNLWKELETGPDVPNTVGVVVEIPNGSRNKYEYDRQRGEIRLNRILFSAIHYPGDYGLIPQTFCDDGDLFDVLVMVNGPTLPLCVIEALPIGLFRIRDRDMPDDKILGVPASDPLFRDYHDTADIPQHFLAEVEHFFHVYKDLEGLRVKTLRWENAEQAMERIVYAAELYKKKIS